MRSLPYHSIPFRDELLSSWLVRLSLGNGCKPHTLCSILLPNIEIWTRDIDRSATSALFSRLALMSKEFVSIDFKQHTLQFYHRCFDGGISTKATNVGILPVGIYHRLRKHHGLQYCPLCLGNDKTPYYRRHWRLSIQYSCEEHNCFLLNGCSICARPLMPHRLDCEKGLTLASCSHCQHDLSDERPHFADAAESVVQHQLDDMVRKGYIDIVNNRIDCILFLQGYFQLSKLIMHWSKRPNVCHYLERTLNVDLRIVSNYPLSFKHIEYIICPYVRATLAVTIFTLLEQWPHRFIKIMTDLHILSSGLRKSRNSLPFWLDSIIASHLYRPHILKNKRPTVTKPL